MIHYNTIKCDIVINITDILLYSKYSIYKRESFYLSSPEVFSLDVF